MSEAAPVYQADLPADPAARADELLARAADRLREIETELAEKRLAALRGEARLVDLLELQTERLVLREFKDDGHHLKHAAKRLIHKAGGLQ